jgi:ubiquinone/menaquinone biosynthesis C-methylase UbiE
MGTIRTFSGVQLKEYKLKLKLNSKTNMTLKLKFREYLFRIWYSYVNKIDKNAEVLFMNYGFHDKNQKIIMDEQNENNRYSIQLYHHLASAVELENKDIVEVGCGRGGGLSYIARNFSTASAVGVDLNKHAVSFCNRHHKMNGLSFLQGDAQKLGLDNNTCDIVINVESSHRYPNMKAFLYEVFRILRPGGYFLITDFRHDYNMEGFKKDMETCGLTMIKERIINEEVIAALELDDMRKRILINKLVPKFLHSIALNFAGAIGSDTYNRIISKKYIYFSYVLKKM